ncbi:hypothetical protein MHU86_23188 [Fragilaria crotonensis]|nr:hypothetical protein MHU86_23188 [Fragilaria crotonensis]
MPEDYVFTGMIAFFLWGFIVESPEQEVYRSKQFQVNDSAREERALNSRKAVKKEATVAPKERNGSIPLIRIGKILKVSESDHPLVLEIQSLMAEKSVLAEEYKKRKSKLNSKRRHTDVMFEEAFGSRRRGNPTLLSENSCDGSSTAMTHMSSTPPTLSVSFPSVTEAHRSMSFTSPSAVLPSTTTTQDATHPPYEEMTTPDRDFTSDVHD